MTTQETYKPENTPAPDLSENLSNLRRIHASQLSVVFTSLFGLLFLFSLISVWKNPVPHLLAISVVMLLSTAATAFSLYAIHRKQPIRAIRILIGTVHFALLIVSLFIADAGFSSGLMILIITLIIASAALDTRQTNIALLFAVFSGTGAILLNTIAPLGQYSSSLISFYSPIALIMSVLIFIVLLATKYLISTLQIRIIVSLMGIVIVPLVVNAYITNTTLTDQVRQATNQSLNVAAGQTAHSIDNFLTSNLSSISTEAKIEIFADLLAMPSYYRNTSTEYEEALAILDGLRAKDAAHISSYALLDKNGYVIADSLRSNIGLNYKDSSFFTTPNQTGSSYVSPVEFSPGTNTAYIYFSSPVRNIYGMQVGILRVRYDAFLLQEMLNNNANIFEQANPILIDENGILLADTLTPANIYKTLIPLSDEGFETLQSQYRLPKRDKADLFVSQENLYQAYKNRQNEPYFTTTISQKTMSGTFTDLSAQPWTVSYLQNEDIFLAPVRKQTDRIILFSAFILAATVLVSILLSQWLIHPIVSLTKIANQITSGDLNAVAKVESVVEVGMLGSAFNVMTRRLRSFIDNLENRVQERTQKLAEQSDIMRYRATQLETVSDVARAIASEQDLEQLLTNVTRLTSERFGFYHVGIFLLDENKEYAVLRAANSPGGKRMLARNHRLQVGQVGIVGYVTGKGEARIATDVGQDAIYFNNPDLPQTRSEMALPLKVKGNVIGALDVQSTESAAFTEEDIALMSTLADQVAIAIDNDRLLAETRQALDEAQSLHKRYLQGEWEKESSERRKQAYKYARGAVVSQEKVDLPEIRKAIISGATSTPDSNNGNHHTVSLAVPIRLRGEVIGVIDLQDANTDRHWTEDEQNMIASVADQVGLALENARLFEQTVRRAERERKALDITNKIRATNDPDVMIQTAVEELRKALRVTRAQIVLQTAEDENSTAPSDAPDQQ